MMMIMRMQRNIIEVDDRNGAVEGEGCLFERERSGYFAVIHA